MGEVAMLHFNKKPFNFKAAFLFFIFYSFFYGNTKILLHTSKGNYIMEKSLF